MPATGDRVLSLLRQRLGLLENRAPVYSVSPPIPRGLRCVSLGATWPIAILGALGYGVSGSVFLNELGKNEDSTTKIL